ncbi:MAG: hypothetical protein ACR2J7_05750 [Luteimonas sp.]
MLILTRLIRWLCVVLGAIGLAVCSLALLDPSILPAMMDTAPLPPHEARWRAAFGLVFSLAILGFGTGVLRHRQLP